jgi:hypothetical protein
MMVVSPELHSGKRAIWLSKRLKAGAISGCKGVNK